MERNSKSEKGDCKQKARRRHKDHVVKLLVRGRVTGQFSQRLFKKLPPRVSVQLKNIVSEEFLEEGHIFLGFTKCGRYVLSYICDCGPDDDSFLTYYLFWWEFNLLSKLKQIHHVRLFEEVEIYSDLYLTVCEWPNDHSHIIVFGYNIQSPNSLMMMNEENRDIYLTVLAMPPTVPCPNCCPVPSSLTAPTDFSPTGNRECLNHGYVLHSRYQVVYPFPTFQPAFQVRKDQVILLNTSFSLVACGISLCPGEGGQTSQILYSKGATSSSDQDPSSSSTPLRSPAATSLPQGSSESRPLPSRDSPVPSSPSQSQAAVRAREFAADLFRRAQEGWGRESESLAESRAQSPGDKEPSADRKEEEEQSCAERKECERQTNSSRPCCLERRTASPPRNPAMPPSPSAQDADPGEPGYINYSQLHYQLKECLLSRREQSLSGSADDKVQLPFTVTDLMGRKLQLVDEPHSGQSVRVEQLTLDFEYLINEVIRRDAEWAPRFCSVSDYDVMILQVCTETNMVMISIGLLLVAFPDADAERYRPNTYHSNLQVSWDLSTGVCCTVGVDDLQGVRGQTSGSVWSSYRKSCVNMVMKWLIPESSCINRMTNEILHKDGTSLQVLADSDRCTWIVL